MKIKLARNILSLVNKKSHAAGVACAERERMELLAALERMRENNASLEEMRQYIEGR